MHDELPNGSDRVGIVATDPLRVLGLRHICERLNFEMVQLSLPGTLDDAQLCLVMIDADCTTHLFELIATFRHAHPQLKLMVLGSGTEQDYVERVIGAGAKGYIPATANENEIRMAIESVRDGSVWAPRKVLSRLLDSHRAAGKSPGAIPRYTARELQVLQLLRAGKSNREIALDMGIDESTVKAHISRLMRKVGVNNRIALTVHPFTQLD